LQAKFFLVLVPSILLAFRLLAQRKLMQNLFCDTKLTHQSLSEDSVPTSGKGVIIQWLSSLIWILEIDRWWWHTRRRSCIRIFRHMLIIMVHGSQVSCRMKSKGIIFSFNIQLFAYCITDEIGTDQPKWLEGTIEMHAQRLKLNEKWY
jgi:hypothetical protein